MYVNHMFAFQMSWLLSAYTTDSWLPSREAARGSLLLHLIQSEKIRPPPHFGYVHTIPYLVYVLMYTVHIYCTRTYVNTVQLT